MTSGKPKRKSIFISYADDEKNRPLVEILLRRFLTELGFRVYTFKDARSDNILQKEISRLIDECSGFLAFLTKDIEEDSVANWHPRGNIPSEIATALALHHNVIIYHERGVSIPSNTKSYYCRPFVNNPNSYGELLIDLVKALKNQNLLHIQSSNL